MSDHIPDVTKMIGDTPISDSTPHNVAELGVLCRKLERELDAANERIKRMEEMYEGEIGENEQFLGSNLQGLLIRELNWSKERIKRLEQAGDELAGKHLFAVHTYDNAKKHVAEWYKSKEGNP